MTTKGAMLALMAGACVLGLLGHAQAQTLGYVVAGGNLKTALDAWAHQFGRQVLYKVDDIREVHSAGAHQGLSANAALDAILAGTGFGAQIDPSGAVAIIRGPASGEAGAGSAAAEGESADIVVTGTHLKGVPVTSPVTTLTADKIRDAGQRSLAQALADLPQNFGGGQNPGVGLVVAGADNESGASTIDLRGIGGDATLTLLNGHRLSYDASGQSIDISSIPLLAVDRVEVVADGASALYGSDAVAGVANIVLRRDFQGLTADARIGGATDGGAFEQQYGLLSGMRWNGGGFMAAYEFSRTTSVTSADHDYARDLAPGLTLVPYLKHHDLALSAHQDIAPGLTAAVDIMANKRWNSYDYAVDNQGNYLLNGGRVSSVTTSLAVSPSLNWTSPGGWTTSIVGLYGRDHNHYADPSYFDGQISYNYKFCNCNAARSVEANTTGSLARLPGGPFKVAAGVGYRSNTFSQTITDLRATQATYYAYGEADVPVFSPDNHSPLGYRLLFTGAVRYEDYPAIDRVVTPKLGLLYEPNADFTLKASWGRSFKAPTLYQQISPVREALEPASAFGGSAAASATAIELGGGSTALKPERATSWSTTLQWHPSRIDGLKIEATYFNIEYRDRVVIPIQYDFLALTSSRYAQFVTFSPTSAEIASAMTKGEFLNYSGAPFDPNNVVAIIDDRYVNAGRQLIHGVDANVSYTLHMGLSSYSLTGAATYLRSQQQLSSDQPLQALAGTLYNPPHLRARAGLIWTHAPITLAAFANYTGGVRDQRSEPTIGVRSMTTLDLNGRYAPDRMFGTIADLEFSLTVQNLFNRRPGILHNTEVYQQPYDSTNYSTVGRVIAVGIRKSW